MQIGRFSQNTNISSFDIVSVYKNVDVAVPEQLLENEINENIQNELRGFLDHLNIYDRNLQLAELR